MYIKNFLSLVTGFVYVYGLSINPEDRTFREYMSQYNLGKKYYL